MSDAITVSSLDVRDESKAVALLARSFHHDPLLTALAPRGNRRRRLAELVFGDVVRRALAWGDCYGAWQEGRLIGTALWLPPGTHRPRRGRLEALGFGARAWFILGLRTLVVARVAVALEAAHPSRPHWYVPFVGVEEGWRGRGAGTRMLAAALARVDADGLPTYLETFNPQALPLYRRAGFDVTGELRLREGLPTGWQLWRPGRLGLT